VGKNCAARKMNSTEVYADTKMLEVKVYMNDLYAKIQARLRSAGRRKRSLDMEEETASRMISDELSSHSLEK
jgi:hypothetical protein